MTQSEILEEIEKIRAWCAEIRRHANAFPDPHAFREALLQADWTAEVLAGRIRQHGICLEGKSE